MCVFICANPNVYHWLDPLLVRLERQSLPKVALVSHFDETKVLGSNSEDSDFELPDDCRRWWCPPPRARFDVRPSSAHEWHKPLEALANAWGRLLLLVGWRR
jgi:hypothetical protein